MLCEAINVSKVEHHQQAANEKMGVQYSTGT